MQRAAASSPGAPKSPASPSSEPSSKRQRLSNGTSKDRRSTSDMEAVRVAMAEEDSRKVLALERHAAEVGEERWVLDVAKSTPFNGGLAAMQIEVVGMSNENESSESDDEDGEDEVVGKKKYGPKVSDSRQGERH
jgi:hypothetical protein